MIISILSSIVIWGLIAVIILRAIKISGNLSFGNKALSYITGDLRLKKREEKSIPLLKIFIYALIFRLAVFLFEIIALHMFAGQHFTFSSLLRRLEIWDCTNYYRIADVGYSGYTEEGKYTTLVFFPLYPYIAKILNAFLRNLHISLLVTSFLAYAGGCVFLYKLCLEDYSEASSKRALIYASVFPFSLFFGTMMSESMLFLTSAMTLYFIRKHKWIYAGIAGALAATSRMAGVLLAVPAAVEWFEHYRIIERLREKKFKEVCTLLVKKGLPIGIMVLGLAVYFGINYCVGGSPFTFLDYQSSFWSNGSVYFGKGIANIAKHAFDISNTEQMFTMWLPLLCCNLLCIVMIAYGARRNRSMYSAYFLAYILLNASVAFPISGCRYMCCAIPLFMFLADFSERHKKADLWITICFAILYGIFLVAYLQNKII